MDNQQELIVYCEDSREFKQYCDVCDAFCIQRFYKNHLKSRSHMNNISNKST